MTLEPYDGILELLAGRGVSRRDFLAYCASLAAAVGLSEAAVPQVAAALQSAALHKPVVWLTQGSCTGCTESLAQSGNPDVPALVLELLSVDYWETVMAAAGDAAEKAKAEAIARGGYILVVEGAIMRGFGGQACRIAGKTGLEHLKAASKKADVILAVGSCAVDGGWLRAVPSSAGSDGVGVKDVPEHTNGKPIVNLPSCPVNPEWVLAVVLDHVMLGKMPALDSRRRPKLAYGQSIHDGCPRRGHFDNGEFVEAFGTPAEAAGWCLYKMGCKGPQTYAACPRSRWNRKTSWCVEAGSPCIGCANPDWVGADAPFLARMPGVAGVSPEVIGAGIAAAALTGVAAHGVARVIRGHHHAPPPPPPARTDDSAEEVRD